MALSKERVGAAGGADPTASGGATPSGAPSSDAAAGTQRSLLQRNLAPSVFLTVFLPDRSPLRVRVRERATVHDCIDEVLRTARRDRQGQSGVPVGAGTGTGTGAGGPGQGAAGAGTHGDGAGARGGKEGAGVPPSTQGVGPPSGGPPPIVLPGDAWCYELRMHEHGGEPDLDFPALERDRRMRHFSSSGVGGNEYCLVEIDGALAAFEARRAQAAKQAKIAAAAAAYAGGADGGAGAGTDGAGSPRGSGHGSAGRASTGSGRSPPAPVFVGTLQVVVPRSIAGDEAI